MPDINKNFYYNKKYFYIDIIMENFVLDQVRQVSALFKPIRLELLTMLDEPRTCGQLAEARNTSPQKIYYHVKVLERAGLVKKVSEKRVRGIMQGYYQAVAESYWLSPQLVNQLGGERRSKGQMSLGYLLGLAEQVQNEVAPLLKSKGEVPSLGVSAQINLQDGTDRASFLEELQELVQELAEKYGAEEPDQEEGGDFRLILACYPRTGND
jgi:DNA-binding transcriptional ArsR family regulator